MNTRIRVSGNHSDFQTQQSHIGKALEMLRLNRNWSQIQAANRVEIAPSTWHFIEQEGSMPQYATFIKITEVFEVNPVVLLLLGCSSILIGQTAFRDALYFSYNDQGIVHTGHKDEFDDKVYLKFRKMMGHQRKRAS